MVVETSGDAFAVSDHRGTPPMTVIYLVCGYDCHAYLVHALASIKAQTHPYRVVVIDDDSPCGKQRALVESVNRLDGWTGRVNTARQFCPRNIWDAVQLSDAEPDDVFFILDADDWLPDPDVTARVAGMFADPDVWFAYGGYRSDPPDVGCHVPAPYPPDVIARGTYRGHHLQELNHAICFTRRLWDASITEADLQFDDGTWFTGAYDQAIAFPMLERAGWHQRCVVDDVRYVYRSDNAASDARIHRAEVMDASRAVLSRAPKPPLDPNHRGAPRPSPVVSRGKRSRPVRVRRVGR